MIEALKLIIIGALGGLLGGMGMGGGTVLIPLLLAFTSLVQKSAQAINLISFIPMAIIAIVLHFKNGLVQKKGLLYIVIPACLTAIAGSVCCAVINGDVLKKCFGGFLIVLSFLQFFSDKISKTTNK